MVLHAQDPFSVQRMKSHGVRRPRHSLEGGLAFKMEFCNLRHKLLACTELGTRLLSCLWMRERGQDTGLGEGRGHWRSVGRQKNQSGDPPGGKQELQGVIVFIQTMLY